MKNNSLLCLPRDYDFYSILLPLHGIIKKWRDKYLYAELAKRHPCFSDSCCYDSRLRISKKGLFADVVVMQKYRLAEYKNENHRKPIRVEERKRNGFFCEKMPFMIYLAAVLLVLVFIGALLGKGIKAEKSQKTTVIVQNKPQAQNQSAAARFLLFAAQNGAQLYSFTWRAEGFVERFSTGIKNIYPQALANEFPDASFSVVSYENEIPSFTVQMVQKFQNERVNASIIPQNFITTVRTMLKKNGALVQEESVNPYGIKIVVPQDKNQSEIIRNLFSLIYEQKLIVQSVSVSHTGQGLCVSINFSLEGIDCSNQLCKALMNNSELFVVKTKPVVPVAVEIKKAVVQKNMPQTADNNHTETPVGKLIKKDGTVIQFVKDEKGKIFRRQEEEK